MIVQHVQLVRFEWHPELPGGQRVVLSNLGEEFFISSREDPRLLFPVIEGAIPQSISRLKVRAFIGDAVVPMKCTQTLSVLVLDQKSRPVAIAAVDFTLSMPGGIIENFSMESTQNTGIASASIPIAVQEPGPVYITVNVKFGEIVKRTRTSFQTWWGWSSESSDEIGLLPPQLFQESQIIHSVRWIKPQNLLNNAHRPQAIP